MDQPDWMLMHRVAAGDEAAIGELYDRFSPLVYKVAWQFQPSHAEAEDAVQEIFVRLWQTADRFDPRRAKLVTWVMLIARRHLIDRLRRSSVRPKTSSMDAAATDFAAPASRPEQAGDDAEIAEGILEKIAELPELQRLVIERAYLQGFTLREVSDQIGSPLGTVKSALSRGLARLRERSASDWAI